MFSSAEDSVVLKNVVFNFLSNNIVASFLSSRANFSSVTVFCFWTVHCKQKIMSKQLDKCKAFKYSYDIYVQQLW